VSNILESVSIAPFDRDLELTVLSQDGPHAVVFPYRLILGAWVNAETRKLIDVRPTHWREWQEAASNFPFRKNCRGFAAKALKLKAQ
jgi:hypothetical protein